MGNRTALIRVPGYEKSARIEYRAGDGTMNIYLGFTALLAAGLDGVENKIEPMSARTRLGILFFNNHVRAQAPQNAQRMVKLLQQQGLTVA